MSFSYANIPPAILDGVVQKHFGGQHLTRTKVNEYNLVCPYCGDINRPNKKKAYIYRDSWMFHCFKCGFHQHIMTYLHETDDAEYGRILLLGRDDSDKDDYRSKREFEERQRKKKMLLPFMDGELVSLMDNDPLARTAVEFCQRRRIRKQVYDYWFACREGEQFYKRDELGALLLNEQGRPIGNEFKNRLIIPFYKYGGEWTQFDARTLDPNNEMRYRNFDGVKRQAYNIDFLDVTKPFYILEGTIDSTFVSNSIAIGGISHLDEVLNENPSIVEHKENCTIIWDNDQPGELARTESVKKGYKWFDWSNIKEKDINGAVLSGEMPVDESGFVKDEFLLERSRPPEGASILFALEHGDLKERRRREQKEQRMLLLQKMAAKNQVEVFF